MIFGWIGATGLYFGFLFGLRVSGVMYMGYYAMRYCWWHAVLQIGGDGCHNNTRHRYRKTIYEFVSVDNKFKMYKTFMYIFSFYSLYTCCSL